MVLRLLPLLPVDATSACSENLKELDVLRFIDITKGYAGIDAGDEDDHDLSPCCVIVDTVRNFALSTFSGTDVLFDLLDVHEAGGDRAVALVPDGFFPKED